MAGAIIGDRFQIKGFVDKGATARVYLAEDLQSHEHVIVKLYAPDEHMTDRAHELFSREAGHLMELDHPNIIKVVSFGEMGGRPYLVTEPLRGETLHDYLKREQTMPSDLALAMMRHAGLGLSAAHRAGIVHRDVKPGNLFLLGPIGRPHDLKVIDFGMAKDEKSASTSQQEVVMGTVEYMAPEQIVSDPPDARTDVYGLGVVMFRAFTGHLPFDIDTRLELLAHQVFSPAPPASWLNEGIDPRIENVISRATRKKPSNRYASMLELVHDIEQILGMSAEPHEVRAPPEDDDDAYEPRTPTAREAAGLLLKRFGAGSPL